MMTRAAECHRSVSCLGRRPEAPSLMGGFARFAPDP